MDNCARRFLAVADGKLYCYAIGGKEDPNRLLMIRDASPSSAEMAFWNTGPNAFKPLSGLWSPPHQQTTAYEVFMEHPYHDGRIYMRTKDGRIACYDLRKE